jgi:hypothetical protein
VKDRASVYPARANSTLRKSANLFMGKGAATVLQREGVSRMLLKPEAMATSSATSQECRMSQRVGGTETRSVSTAVARSCLAPAVAVAVEEKGEEETNFATSDILDRKPTMSWSERLMPLKTWH